MAFKPTSPDELDKRIEIQATTKISDGMGGTISTFVTLATIWGCLWSVSANEVVQANATVMVVSHRVRIRYRSVLKASWRISYAGKYYNIVSIIDPNMSHEFLDILCKEAA